MPLGDPGRIVAEGFRQFDELDDLGRVGSAGNGDADAAHCGALSVEDDSLQREERSGYASVVTSMRGQAMSMSREFGAFVAGLRYDDLPAAVVDRAKGVTLQALSSALVAQAMPASQQALALMQEEEAGGGGAATVLCHGAKLTKAGAAFVN